MTKPKTRYPISSFGPELMSALIKGGRKKLALKFENVDDEQYTGRRRAKKFQLRIYTLRGRMREENHPDFPIASRAIVSVIWGSKAIAHGAPESWREDYNGKRGALVVIRPQDSEFGDVLTAAGVTVDPPSTPSPVPFAEPTRPAVVPVPKPTRTEGRKDFLDTIFGDDPE